LFACDQWLVWRTDKRNRKNTRADKDAQKQIWRAWYRVANCYLFIELRKLVS